MPGTNANSYALMMSMIVYGGCTYYDIERETGLPRVTIYRYTSALHKKKVIRITGWQTISSRGHRTPEWSLGSGVDAKRPRKLNAAERQRAYRLRKKEMQMVNIFRIAA